MLKNLRLASREYAAHKCEVCKISHPSQKHYTHCIEETRADWIKDVYYHEPAIKFSKIMMLVGWLFWV